MKASYEIHGDCGLTARLGVSDGCKLRCWRILAPIRFPAAAVPRFAVIYVSERRDCGFLKQGTLPPWSVVWSLRIMKRRSRIPLATYRLQLNRDFTFAQATAIVPYLSDTRHQPLLYLSLPKGPSRQHARLRHRGSQLVQSRNRQPLRISTDFVAALHEHGMGLILDIVPNHMGVMGSDNAWWLDVLENGESSIYASFFDIDWQPLKEELHGKVLIPVLHDHYGAVLESGELKLVFHRSAASSMCPTTNIAFPWIPGNIPASCSIARTHPRQELGEQNPDLLEFQSLIAAFGHLPARQEISSDRIAERNRDKEIHKRRLAELCARSPEIADLHPARRLSRSTEIPPILPVSKNFTNSLKPKHFAWRTGASPPTTSTTGAFSTPTIWPEFAWRMRPSLRQPTGWFLA